MRRNCYWILAVIAIGILLCVSRYSISVGVVVGIPFPVYGLENVGEGQVPFYSILSPIFAFGNFVVAWCIVWSIVFFVQRVMKPPRGSTIAE